MTVASVGNPAAAPAAVSLPEGGGAVPGLGETFQADPQTGTGTFTIPLEFPAGRAGLTPNVALSYSTGNGNGPFGLGWSLGHPSNGPQDEPRPSLPRPRPGSGHAGHLRGDRR